MAPIVNVNDTKKRTDQLLIKVPRQKLIIQEVVETNDQNQEVARRGQKLILQNEKDSTSD